MKKIVLVSGGSSGIGTSIVKLFAKEGFRVLFTLIPVWFAQAKQSETINEKSR